MRCALLAVVPCTIGWLLAGVHRAGQGRAELSRSPHQTTPRRVPCMCCCCGRLALLPLLLQAPLLAGKQPGWTALLAV